VRDNVRHELAQVGEAGVDQRQVPMIALQPILRVTAGCSHPVHPDARAEPGADLGIRDVGVRGHRQDLFHQTQPLLRGARSLRQQLVELAACAVFRAGDGLVKHLQHFVEHFDGAFGEGCQQNRVALVGLPAG
jgi:hypothetical protein